MEILIRLDDDDKKAWTNILELNQQVKNNVIAKNELQKTTAKFWYDMIEKYPYLKNKQLGMNFIDGYIFSYNSFLELYKYRS